MPFFIQQLEMNQISMPNVVTGTTVFLLSVSLGTAYVVVTPGLASEVVMSLFVFILGLFWVVSKYVFPYFSAPYSKIAEPDLELGVNESKKDD